jgi:hypothetical protein
LQEWYHKVLGLFNYPYWETQIPNSIGINVGLKYIAPINAQQSEHNLFRIITASEINFGSYFNNAKASAYFCFGKFNKVEHTALFNNHINTTSTSKNTSEWVFFSTQWLPIKHTMELYKAIFLSLWINRIYGIFNHLFISIVLVPCMQKINGLQK